MIEQAAIELLQVEYNYTPLMCYTEKPEILPDGTDRADKKQTVLPQVLLERLCAINPDIPQEIVKLKADELCRIHIGEPLLANYENYRMVRNGVTVEYKKDGRVTHGRLRLVDFDIPENNSYIAASQMWIRGEVHCADPT